MFSGICFSLEAIPFKLHSLHILVSRTSVNPTSNHWTPLPARAIFCMTIHQRPTQHVQLHHETAEIPIAALV